MGDNDTEGSHKTVNPGGVGMSPRLLDDAGQRESATPRGVERTGPRSGDIEAAAGSARRPSRLRGERICFPPCLVGREAAGSEWFDAYGVGLP